MNSDAMTLVFERDAKIRELRAEIERLEAEINQRTIAAAERREQLFAEIERLRALLSGYVNAYRDKRGITYEMEQDARRALEGKAERPGPPYDAAYEQNKRRR